MYGASVTASTSKSEPAARCADAYASAVAARSPRFTSPITRSPRARAPRTTPAYADIPATPYASKKATFGFTQAACGATTSSTASEKRSNAFAASPSAAARPSAGILSMRGSSPTHRHDDFERAAASRRSAYGSRVGTGAMGGAGSLRSARVDAAPAQERREHPGTVGRQE